MAEGEEKLDVSKIESWCTWSRCSPKLLTSSKLKGSKVNITPIIVYIATVANIPAQRGSNEWSGCLVDDFRKRWNTRTEENTAENELAPTV